MPGLTWNVDYFKVRKDFFSSLKDETDFPLSSRLFSCIYRKVKLVGEKCICESK